VLIHYKNLPFLNNTLKRYAYETDRVWQNSKKSKAYIHPVGFLMAGMLVEMVRHKDCMETMEDAPSYAVFRKTVTGGRRKREARQTSAFKFGFLARKD
jgi:hypothetical protein